MVGSGESFVNPSIISLQADMVLCLLEIIGIFPCFGRVLISLSLCRRDDIFNHMELVDRYGTWLKIGMEQT